MQWDIKLNSDGDIDLSTGSMQLISDKKEAILQRFTLKFGTFTKEWFWKQSYGGIDRDLLFTKGVEQQMLDAWFLSKIQEDPDVEQILSYSSSVNKATRSYDLTFSVLIDDETIEVALPLNLLSTDAEVVYPDSSDYNSAIQQAIANQTDVSTSIESTPIDYIYAVKSTAPYFSVVSFNTKSLSQAVTFQTSTDNNPVFAPHCLGVNPNGTKVALGYWDVGGDLRFADIYLGQPTGYSKIQTLSSPTVEGVAVGKLIWNEDSSSLGVFNELPTITSNNQDFGHFSYVFNPVLNFLTGPYVYTSVPDDPYVFDSDGRGNWIAGDATGTSTVNWYSSIFNTRFSPQFNGNIYLTSRVRQLASASDGSFCLFAIYTTSPAGVAVYRWFPNSIPNSNVLVSTTAITALTCLSISYDKKYIVLCNGGATVAIYKLTSTGAVLLGNLTLPGSVPVSEVKWSKDSKRLYCKRVGTTNATYNLFYYEVDEHGIFTYKADITGSNLTTIYGWDIVTKYE